MTIYTGAYVGARSCTSGPQPGAWGALDYYLSAYKSKGAVSDGIYNCRSVRGGRTTSIHGEGRAIDMGVRPASQSWATALANAIVAMSKELGVQCVIWNRKIWSSQYPHSGWRSYSGVDPHTLHLHVELTWASARQGRAAAAKKWAKVLGGVKPGDVVIGGGGGGNTYKTITGKTPLVKLYTKGEPVKRAQKAVGVKADGYWGPASVAAAKKWQKANGLAADGMIGDKSWAVINGGKAKPAPKPKAGKAPKFPWPSGHYIGPKSGPTRSHSGAVAADRPAIRQWQNQMKKRGWGGIGKADGLYGPKLQKVARQFQKEKGLSVDGLVGAATWRAAWEEKVT